MIYEQHSLILTKLAERRLQGPTVEKNRDAICNAVNNRSLNVSGWFIEPSRKEHFVAPNLSVINGEDAWEKFENYEGGNTHKYEMYLSVSYESKMDKKPDYNVFHSILRSIFTKSAQPGFGKWTLSRVDGKEYEEPDDSAIPLSDDFAGYAQVSVPDNLNEYFDHLYGLDAHVSRIARALHAGLASEWNNRFHCALIGPPGCGKSDICQSFKRALGEEAVLEFDATATTAAGAIKELAEREILPQVLIIEEIEKSEEKAVSFLLAVLDLRAEIRKTTARATIQRDTKLFAICTVNNEDLFEKIQAGALASRFSNKIYFQRPDRDQLQLILQREVSKIGGDFAWIDPALDYCEAQGITDPRAVTALCLCGTDMLVTGEYQKMLAATAKGLPPADPGYPEVSLSA